MSDKITPIKWKIVIDETRGDGGKDLHNCYFLPTDVPGVYNLYDQHSRILAAYIVAGQNFNFTVDDIHYDIHRFEIDDFAARGDWKNNAPVPVDEQEGTFQAQSGGGVPVDDAVDKYASTSTDTPPANAIEIKIVSGGADKDKLKHCYFVPTAPGGPYDFYSKHGTELATGLTSGTDFDFTHDSIEWSVTDFVISDTEASGHWTNPDNISADFEQEGTFQAQSGGGVPEGEESASAASA
ncbi:MAG TPA: hypothetical protein VGJ37_07590 [Pyrinomonadaceae bacterium]|jgi:hypothetical protein